MGRNTDTIISIVAVAAIVYAVYKMYRMHAESRTSYSSAGYGPEDSIQRLFVDAVSKRLDAVAQCIATEFRKRYDYGTAKSLVTADAFRNNQEVRQILDQCAFNVIQHMFSIVSKAASTDCGKNNVKAVVAWIVANVEFRMYSEAEVDDIVKLSDTMTCWSKDAIFQAVKLTKERIEPVVQASFPEALRAPFLAHKKYAQWVSSQLYFGAVYRFKEAGRLPSEYPRFISAVTPEEFDKHVDGALAKLVSQARIAEYVYSNAWCKDTAQLLAAMDDTPFEIYSPEQVERLGREILAKWCWDPQTIVAQTRDVLDSVL